jgi:hypothetical protein
MKIIKQIKNNTFYPSKRFTNLGFLGFCIGRRVGVTFFTLWNFLGLSNLELDHALRWFCYFLFNPGEGRLIFSNFIFFEAAYVACFRFLLLLINTSIEECLPSQMKCVIYLLFIYYCHCYDWLERRLQSWHLTGES